MVSEKGQSKGIMVSVRIIFVAIAIIVVILAASAVGLFFFLPKITTGSTINSSTICTSSCSLDLVSAGAGPLLSSPMTTPMGLSDFPADGPCCSQPPVFADEINYTDKGNLWTLQGDLEPMGGAWAFANSSGLTIEYQPCPTTGNLSECGPHSEFWHDKEAFDDSSIYGDLGAIPVLPAGAPAEPRSLSPSSMPPITAVPSGASMFSIEVYLPYHSYYPSCTEDFGSGGQGCTYESSIGPYDSATLGFDVGGNYDIVSVAEICNNPCTSNALLLSAYTSSGGASVDKMLNSITIPTFTPLHTLTIATDRKSFIDFYVDNTPVYSSSTLPIEQNPAEGSGVIEFSARTNINNETDVVTFSNATVYSGSTISVSGLKSGMTAVVTGPNGFKATASANSSGIASVDVATEPANLMVSVESDGNTIASYPTPVSAGTELRLTY